MSNSQCPRCGSAKTGVWILQCKECDTIYCEECGDSAILRWAKCPDCGGTPLPVRQNDDD